MRWWVVLLLVGCENDRSRPDSDPATGNVHPVGILDEESDDFHGRELARRGYDLALCATCHGDDFGGGKAGVTCNNCHTEGPTACVTCHGDGPTTGNHITHRIDAKLACAECHTVPDRWDAPGHIGSVEVTFGALASLGTAPTYVNGACGVYCHGDARPSWDATPMRGCDRCHGAPPPSHAQNQCETCHPNSGTLAGAVGSAHLDGALQVGRTSGCDGCHGGSGDPAPPTDLFGNQFTTALGVGAHQAHLQVPSGLRAAIACSECHAIPSTTNAPGHIDSMLPAEVNGSLGWNRTTGTCATAWCHGPATPRWTENGGAFCGSCHGVPPATGSHTPNMSLIDCAGCHPAGFAKHIDGVLDVL